MLKFILFFITLLIIGIGITLSLPEYKVESGDPVSKHRYTIDIDTLKTPLPMSSYFLQSTNPPGAMFALRLGLYSKLQQATEYADSLSLDDDVVIVKTTDAHREWHIVFLGPFNTIKDAEVRKHQLQKKQISATLMSWPPKSEKGE